jgi:endo-1,4-beta-mannosidase
MSGNSAKLSALSKALAVKWDETKNHWRDDKSQEFERQYIEELLNNVDKAVTVMEQLDKLLAKVKHDCE